MRPFRTIEADIESTDQKISKLKDDISKSKYSAGTRATGSFIRTIIWEIILAGLVFIVSMIFGYYEKGYLNFTIFIIALSVLFFVLSIIASVKYTKKPATIPAAIVFLVISSILFVTFSYNSLIWCFTKDNVLIALIINADKEIFKTTMGVTMEMFINSIIFALFAVLPSSLILFIGSLVKLLSQIRIKKSRERKVIELTNQLNKSEIKYKNLTSELSKTKSEADRLFKEEINKQEPDTVLINELSALGLEEATVWIANKVKQDNLNEGRRIYESEIQKDSPDMKMMAQAAKLGDPNASVWVAKKIELTYVPNVNSYANAELREKNKELQAYIKTAVGSNNSSLYCVIEALGRLFNYAYGDPDDIESSSELLATLKVLRLMKENNKLQGEDLKLLDFTIEKYVDSVDSAQRAEEKIRKRKEEREREENSGSSYSTSYVPIRCRYDAGGICTKKSTTYCKINCFYSRGSDQLLCSDFSRA